MKLICLNTWAGRGGKENLLNFFKRYQDTDIFCLQEMSQGDHVNTPEWGEGMDTNLVAKVQNILKNHSVFFHPYHLNWFGLAIFIKKDLLIEEEGDIFVFKNREQGFDDDKTANHARNLQYITFETAKGKRTILNFHGLWNGLHKDDCPERITQSENIKNFIKDISNPYILCGDFNLGPDTQSMKMLENLGLRNLIKENNITSTRSSLYKKPFQYADYMLISAGIRVNEFKMLPDEVSDHLAMYLDFD